MRSENQDIFAGKCVRDDNVNPSYDETSNLKAWKSHYEKLLNVEFWWDSDSWYKAEPISDPPIFTTQDMISKAIAEMKIGKVARPSGIVIEIFDQPGKKLLTPLPN